MLFLPPLRGAIAEAFEMKAMNRVSHMAGGLLVMLGAVSTAQGDIMAGDTISLTFLNASPSQAVAWTFDGD